MTEKYTIENAMASIKTLFSFTLTSDTITRMYVQAEPVRQLLAIIRAVAIISGRFWAGTVGEDMVYGIAKSLLYAHSVRQTWFHLQVLQLIELQPISGIEYREAEGITFG